MKRTLSTISVITLSCMGILAFSTPVHADIFGNKFIQQKISDSKGNIYQNRNDRNEMLQERNAKPPTPEERQNALIKELSVSFANLQNIYVRLTAASLQASTSGQDSSRVNGILSTAGKAIAIASSTISDIVTTNTRLDASSTPDTSTATDEDFYDLHANTVTVIQSLNFIKDTLQQAIDALKNIM